MGSRRSAPAAQIQGVQPMRMYAILRDAHDYKGSYETVLRSFHQAMQAIKPQKPEAYICAG